MVDNFFRGQIRLVADQQFIHIFTCIALDFLKPLLNVVERFLICAIINYDDTVSPTIVWRCNLRKWITIKMVRSDWNNSRSLTVRNRSWPAVSQICNFIVLSSSSIVLIFCRNAIRLHHFPLFWTSAEAQFESSECNLLTKSTPIVLI